MGKEILMFGDIEIEKIYRHENPIFLKDADIEKVLVSKKISSVEKTINTPLVTCIRIITYNASKNERL